MAYNIEYKGLELKTKDGTNIIGSDFTVEIKELDEKKKSFWAIASTETPDRDNDIIRVSGWDLNNYKSNPVGLWAHNYHEHPIFRTEKCRTDKPKKQLLFQPVFDTDYDKGRLSWNQYKNGFLNMFSVGFNPMELSLINPDDLYSGREFTKQELLEISGVPVPSNPEAGVLRSAGMIPDVVNLVTLGYSEEYKTLEDGTIWIPISNSLKGFKEPRKFHIGNGVTAVSAIPLFDSESKSTPAVGYFFDKTFDIEKINEWLKSNNLKTITKKFYTINFKEDGNFDLKIEDEMKDLEIKEEIHEEEIEGSGLGEQTEETKENEKEIKEEVEEVVEIKEEVIEDNEVKFRTIVHIQIIDQKGEIIDCKEVEDKFFTQIFDNSFIGNVKTILNDVKKEILDEVRLMIKEIKVAEVEDDNNKSEENDEILYDVDLSEFKSLVSQDEESKEVITISEDVIKDLNVSASIEDEVEIIFDKTLKELLGNKD